MKKLTVCTLWIALIIIGCAQIGNYFRAEISEVERYYSKGEEAEAAQEWEAAFAHYKRAHDLAKKRKGIIRFNNPEQDNYPYTISLLYKAMDRVGANIVKPGNWQSPMRQQMNVLQKEMFERMTFTRDLFNEAETLAQNNEYLKAMELTDQIIAAYPYSGEAEKARQLKIEYNKKLTKYRDQLLNMAMSYYQQQNYEMAKQSFDQLFSSYPDSPEAVKTKAKIEQYIQQIENAIKINVEETTAAN